MSKFGFIFKKCWKPLFTILIPLLAAFIFKWEGEEYDVNGKAYKDPKSHPGAAFTIIVMALYWITECLPLPVTALVPIVLFPLLEVVSTEYITMFYLNNLVLLLTSGCIIALAFEYSNLHNRIALNVILIVGAEIPRLLFGLMATAMFLSMWMNNTSTTSMMVPIVGVIIEEFEHVYKQQSVEASRKAKALETNNVDSLKVRRKSRFGLSDPDISDQLRSFIVPTVDGNADKKSHDSLDLAELQTKKEIRNLKIMFLLGVAWGSNIGGTGVTIGTATNLLAINEAKRKIDEIDGTDPNRLIPKDPTKCKEILEISFITWMEFAIVPMIISNLVCWAILLIWFTGLPSFLKCWRWKIWNRKIKPSELITNKSDIRLEAANNIKKAIRAKYDQLGPMSLHEILVLTIFLILAALWVLGSSVWYKWFQGETTDKSGKLVDSIYVTDTVPALLMCMLLFFIPKDKKYYKNFFQGGLSEGMRDPLLKWELVETKVPWGPLILIGGGQAISGGLKISQLGQVVGAYLGGNAFLKQLDPWVFLIFILLLVAILTTIASNTATIAILAPVLIDLSTSKGIHPLYLLVVPTLAASFAFILPISTPPNAIVYDQSNMKQKEMAIPGIIVTIATYIVLFGCAHTYNEWIFGFSDYANHKYCNRI